MVVIVVIVVGIAAAAAILLIEVKLEHSPKPAQHEARRRLLHVLVPVRHADRSPGREAGACRQAVHGVLEREL